MHMYRNLFTPPATEALHGTVKVEGVNREILMRYIAREFASLTELKQQLQKHTKTTITIIRAPAYWRGIRLRKLAVFSLLSRRFGTGRGNGSKTCTQYTLNGTVREFEQGDGAGNAYTAARRRRGPWRPPEHTLGPKVSWRRARARIVHPTTPSTH
jgi:hypothetical protein